jgi:hypothetical protein
MAAVFAAEVYWKSTGVSGLGKSALKDGSTLNKESANFVVGWTTLRHFDI